MMYRVFIYGTVLSGLGNHQFVQDQTFVDYALTDKSIHNMYVFARGRIPAVIENGHCRVLGEIYDVDEATLNDLDILEGEGSFYFRVKKDFYLTNNYNWEKTSAFMYVMYTNPSNYLVLPYQNNIVSFKNYLRYKNTEYIEDHYDDDFL